MEDRADRDRWLCRKHVDGACMALAQVAHAEPTARFRFVALSLGRLSCEAAGCGCPVSLPLPRVWLIGSRVRLAVLLPAPSVLLSRAMA